MCFDNSSTSKCLNGGYCDSNQVCICASACFVGNFCQINYNAARLPLTGAIIKDLASGKTFYLLVFSLFGICGLTNNILSLTTFLNHRIRLTICGVYLIFFSLFGIALTFTMLTYLITIAQYRHHLYQVSACYVIPFFSVILNDGGILFTTAIAVERTFIECWNFSIHGTRKRGLIITLIIIVYVTCSNMDEFFIRRITTDDQGNQICIYDFDRYPIWRRFDIIFSYTHVVLPCVIHFVCAVCALTAISRRKIFIRNLENQFFRVWFKHVYIHRDFFVAPICLLVCILPHGILGHLLQTCIPYSDKVRLRMHISFVLLLFAPQLFSFILYVYPNNHYWKEFQYTIIYRKLCCFCYVRQRSLRQKKLIQSRVIPLRKSPDNVSKESNISQEMLVDS